MTRINTGIRVRNLSDEHLLAEHREIKRIPNLLYKGIKSNKKYNIPKEFKLGTGHVLFFIDKQKYLYNRYKELYIECINRGFNVENYSSAFLNISTYKKYWNDYNPSKTDIKSIINRICEKIDTSNKEYFHYNRVKYSKENIKKILLNI